MMTYIEKERFCESQFNRYAPYWHVFTSGKDTPIIFKKKDDYVFAMNVFCQTSVECPNVKILTFEVMSNHLHILLAGGAKEVVDYFSFLKKKLSRGLSQAGNDCLPNSFILKMKQVRDIVALRSVLVYINRNGYVVDKGYTPFSYPWGAGRYFFSWIPDVRKYSSTTKQERRRMFRGRVPQLPDNYSVADGYVMPFSYCDIGFASSLFRDAHHYFTSISKSVEMYSSVAFELEDDEYLTDNELFAQVVRILKTTYGDVGLKNLSRSQKMDLAMKLRCDYRSSNSQLRRILGLSQYEVDTMFPHSSD